MVIRILEAFEKVLEQMSGGQLGQKEMQGIKDAADEIRQQLKGLRALKGLIGQKE